MICLFTLRHIPLESVCTHLSVESCVVWKPVNWIAKQIDLLVFIWFGFLLGVFPNRLQYRCILGSSHRKVFFCCNTCGEFILIWITDCHSVTLFENELLWGRLFVFLHLFHKNLLQWLVPQFEFLRKFINKRRV